jgi:uridine kinase
MTVLIGISGGSGSGKTSIAEAIRRRLAGHCTVIGEDSYYKDYGRVPDFDPHSVDFDDAATKDHDLLAAHIRTLKAGGAVDVPRYDFTTHRRGEGTDRAMPEPVVVIEGIHVLTAPLAGLFDLKVFIDVPADMRLARRILRDIGERKRELGFVLDQYFAQVRPAHLHFTEPAKAIADLVISNLASSWRPPEERLEQLLDRAALAILGSAGVEPAVRPQA